MSIYSNDIMSHYIRNVFHILVTLFLAANGYAVTQTIEYSLFDNFNNRDGLVSNRVYDIVQDNDGFLWLATDFGAERFDGSLFHHFNNKKYPGMHRRDVLELHATERGVEMGSSSGVCIEYISKLDSFVDLRPVNYDSVHYKQTNAFYTSKEGERYITTVGGIYKYDSLTKRYSSNNPLYIPTKDMYVKSVYEDEKGRVWLGGINELVVLNKRGKKLAEIGLKEGLEGQVTGIRDMPNGEVLVTSMSGNVVFLCKFTIYGFEYRTKTLPVSNIHEVIYSCDGKIYYGTDGDGLWSSDIDFDNFVHYMPYSDASFDQMRKIYTVFEDRDKNIWIATQNNGIYRLRKKTECGVVSSDQYGVPSFTCSAFASDDEGNIYMGGDGKGLYRMKSDMSEVKLIEMKNNNLLWVERARNGLFRLSTWGGGSVLFDPKTEKYWEEPFKGYQNTEKCIFGTLQCKSGRTLFLTAGGGVIEQDPNTGLCHRQYYRTDDCMWADMWVFKAVESKDGTIWIITTNTIWRATSQDTTHVLPNVANEKSHNPLKVTDGVLDEEGNFFASTSKGVMRFSSDGKKQETLDFLPDCEYLSIVKTNDGRFFVTRFGGVLCFDYKKKTYFEIPGYFGDFAKSYFYERSIMEKDGKVYIGTNTGFYVIDYEHLNSAQPTEMCRFGNLYINGSVVRPRAEGVLKEGMLSELDELVLPSSLSANVEIDIDVIDYNAGVQPVVSYRLSGSDSGRWNEVGKDRKLQFTYLPEGEHKLEVRISKPGTRTEDCMLALNVNVLPPWWRSGIAILVWVSLVLLAIFAAYKYRMMRFNQQKQMLKEMVEERTAELRIALTDKDRLISVVAHDLKNPMFGIVGALERERENNSNVNQIYNQAVSLQNEMVDLVNWAKEKRESLQATFAKIDIEAIVSREMSLLEGVISSKEISIEKNTDVTHYGWTDSRLFGTMIRNIINNAVKFTPRGGNIKVSALEREGNILICVADSGVGMSKEKVMELLNNNSYQHTEGTEKEMSTGIGLSIVKDYATKLGTKIEIVSEEGNGTSISFVIKASDDVVRQIVSERETVEIDTMSIEDAKILVVDDDDLIRDNLYSYLSKYCIVIVAKNGAEGLQMVQSEMPDFVLSDVQMPIMNGIEMYKAIVNDKNLKHIPLMFMSANTDEVDRILGLSAGAIDYINKPFEQKEILLKISNSFRILRNLQEKIVERKINGESVKSEEINPLIAEVFKMIETNYSDSALSVDKMASELAISPATLNRRTRSLSGKTPIEMLTEYRMNKSMEMLKEGKYSVTDVAYAVGFSDPAYFSRKFKEFFGESPSKVIQ